MKRGIDPHPRSTCFAFLDGTRVRVGEKPWGVTCRAPTAAR
jgi:hypothetical protein